MSGMDIRETPYLRERLLRHVALHVDSDRKLCHHDILAPERFTATLQTL